MLGAFIAIIFLFVILTFVWPPDSPWSPWWRTDKKIARAACRLAKVTDKDVVYELGSGDGEFILTAAKIFKAKKAVGIEIDYSRYYVAQIKKRIRNIDNVKFIRSDFKKVKLTDATIVYFYLVPAVIMRIIPQLKKDLKPGTKIVSYHYMVPLQLEKKSGKLYLYKI